MAIESIAIFTEQVSSLDKSIKTVETNTQNQETIKATLSELKSATERPVKIFQMPTKGITKASSLAYKILNVLLKNLQKLLYKI